MASRLSAQVRALGFLAAAVIYASQSAADPPPDSALAREAAGRYRLEASGPGLFAEADVFLLPDRAPVTLEAELRLAAPLPDWMREVSRTMRWRASSGQTANLSESHERSRTDWIPGDGSALARIEAEAWITVETVPGGGAPQEPAAVIHKKVGFAFLAPLEAPAPFSGVIDGYEIGNYPDPDDPDFRQKFKVATEWPTKRPDRYQPPRMFYRVGTEDKALKLSPRLTLGHFTIDYPWGSLGMPQYLTIDPRLVEKIEALAELINAGGKFKADAIVPVYGFRPPSFNLGTIESNPESTLKVPFSMHQYGRALDFIIDADGDLVMDDLNGDGKHDVFDAVEIMHYVNILDRQYRSEGKWEKVGGAGIYARHDFTGRPPTPYIHVDTRGFQSDTGVLIRWAEGWPKEVELNWGKM